MGWLWKMWLDKPFLVIFAIYLLFILTSLCLIVGKEGLMKVEPNELK